jgi:hypothetical protein
MRIKDVRQGLLRVGCSTGRSASGGGAESGPLARGWESRRLADHLKMRPDVNARSPWMACPVQRDAGDSAERARLRSSPDCQAEDALFAARSLQAQHLVLGAPLFAVAATT